MKQKSGEKKSNQRHSPLIILQSPIHDSQFETNSLNDDHDEYQIPESRRGLLEAANAPFQFILDKSKTGKESNTHVTQFITLDQNESQLMKKLGYRHILNEPAMNSKIKDKTIQRINQQNLQNKKALVNNEIRHIQTQNHHKEVHLTNDIEEQIKFKYIEKKNLSDNQSISIDEQTLLVQLSHHQEVSQMFSLHEEIKEHIDLDHYKRKKYKKRGDAVNDAGLPLKSKDQKVSDISSKSSQKMFMQEAQLYGTKGKIPSQVQNQQSAQFLRFSTNQDIDETVKLQHLLYQDAAIHDNTRNNQILKLGCQTSPSPEHYNHPSRYRPRNEISPAGIFIQQVKNEEEEKHVALVYPSESRGYYNGHHNSRLQPPPSQKQHQQNKRKESSAKSALSHRQISHNKRSLTPHDEYLEAPQKNAETAVQKMKVSKFQEETKNEMENKKKKYQSTKKNLDYRSHLNIPHSKKSDNLLDDESRDEIQSMFGKVLFDKIRDKNTVSAQDNHLNYNKDKRLQNQSRVKRILVESSISDSEQLSSNLKNDEIDSNQLSSVGLNTSNAQKQNYLLQVPSFLGTNSKQQRKNSFYKSYDKSITQRHNQYRKDNQTNQMAQIFEIANSGNKVQKNFPKESFFYLTENKKQRPSIKQSMANNNHMPISLGFNQRQEKNKSAKDLNVQVNKKKSGGAALYYQEQDSQFNKIIKSFQIMNDLNNEGRQSKDELLKKHPSLDRFSRTNYGGEDPSNVNDISGTGFTNHFEKAKTGAPFTKKRLSKSLDGDDDFKDDFQDNLPAEFKEQEKQEGEEEGEPQTVVPEETPMQRLIKALKQARAEKEARERAEALRIAEGSDAADKNIDAKSADSALVNASIERRCFNLINPEKFIIQPHDKFRGFWDILITLLIIITCMYAPYTLAFQMSANSTALLSIDTFINVIFLGDIIINMMSAYQDNDFNIVTDHKVIIKKYLLSWFIIDVLSIIPFDLMLGINFQDDASQLTGNYTKLSRLNRLLRLTRMIRLLKMLHVDNMYLRKLADFLDIGSGSERLLFLTLILLLLQHVVACIWIFIAKYDSVSRENWIFKTGYTDAGDWELYVTSFYFTVTTIMTVGYGDITPDSVTEKLITILLMLIGVVLFSYATGSISSIISSADSEDARLKEKMGTLKELQGDYDLELGLFNKIAKALQYGNQHAKGVVEFMDELPTKLRIELAMAIHKKMYSNIKFFKDKDKSFIVWVGTLLKPMNVQTDDFIYKDYEYITEIYFLVKGKAGYVLPKYPTQVYIEIEQGELFGHVDLAYNKAFFKNQKNFKKALNKNKDDMRRNFTVRAQDSCDILTLSMDDLEKMMLEFPDVYYELMNDASETLTKHEKIKMEEMQRIEIEKAKQKSQLNSNISSVFMNRLLKNQMNPSIENNPQIAEASQQHLNNFHMRGGGPMNNKRMKKQGGYRFKNATFNYMPQPNQQVGLGDSNDNFIGMTSQKPTTIPHMMHGSGDNSLGPQSQFNETAGFGDQSVKLENNNMKQMISTGTPRADGGARGKYESSRKVVSFQGRQPKKIESTKTLGFNNNFNQNSNNPPLINNNSQLNNQRVVGDNNQDVAISTFQGEGSSIANNQQLHEAARSLNLTVNNNNGVTAGAGEINNNQSAANLLNNLDQAAVQQAQNQFQQPEDTQNSQQEDVDYGSNYNQGEDYSEDSEVDSDEELRQMKNMMYSLASRVDMMHKEQRQILRILMLQAQGNNGNSANGATNMFAPTTLQVPQISQKKSSNQPQQPQSNPPISPQQYSKFTAGPGSAIRNVKQMKPK